MEVEREFLGGNVSSAFDVPSLVVVIADVDDEEIFGFALDERFKLLWRNILDHRYAFARISA